MTAAERSRFAFLRSEDTPESEALRLELGLPAISSPGPEYEFVLEQRQDGLQLTWLGHAPPLRLRVDLESGPLARRLRTARRSQPLPRAVGLHRRRPSVVDATAGLGRDALVLASLGASVTAVERHPVLAALLRDGLERSGRRDLLEIVVADAVGWLRELPEDERPEVVYLDPMFPARPGAAQVRKEMQVCRAMLGPGDESPALFAAARGVARDRVVVKRHPHQPELADRPSHSVRGGRVRYDVYLVDGRDPLHRSRN